MSRPAALAFLLALLTIAGPASADELGARLAKVDAAYAKSVVPVDVTVRVTLEGLPGMNPKDNQRTIRSTATGVVVGPRLVLLSSEALTEGATVFEMLGARAKTRVVQLAVRLGKGLRLGARFVAEEPGLGLTLIRLDSESDLLAPITIPAAGPEAGAAAALPGVGGQIALLSTGPRLLGAPRIVTASRVAGQATRPHPLTLLDPPHPEANGALACDLSGAEPKPVGLHIRVPLSSLPATGNGPGRRTYDAGDLNAARRGYVVPFAAITPWLKKASEVKESKIGGGQRRRRSWIGVEIQVITPELATALGLDYDGVGKVTKVYAETPAAKAGLKTGDLIIQLDGEACELAAGETMRDLVGDYPPGTEVELKVVREGKASDLALALAESPSTPLEAERLALPAHGFSVRDLTFFDSAPKDLKGLVVERVEARGSARLAGLKKGDIITAMDEQPVESVDQARARISSSKSLAVTVRRGEETVQLRIPVS